MSDTYQNNVKSHWCSGFVSIICLAIVFIEIIFGFVFQNHIPMTIILTLLCAVSLLLFNSQKTFILNTLIAQLLAFLVFICALLTILQYLSGLMIFSQPMTFLTSVNFVFVSIALHLYQSNFLNNKVLQIITLLVLLSSFFSLLTYIYDVDTSYRIIYFTRMKLMTSIIFLLLGIALMLSKPESGFIKILFENSLSGYLLRRVPIFVFLASVVLAILTNKGVHYGWYDNSFGDITTLLTSIIILILVLWMNAKILSREEEKRNQLKWIFEHNEFLTRQRLLAQHHISQVIESNKDFNTISIEVLKIVCIELDWQLGELWMVNPEKDQICRVKRWAEDSFLTKLNFLNETNLAFGFGEGMPGRVWQSKESLWEVNDFRVFKTILTVPILYKSEVLGVISFLSQMEKPVDTNMISVLEILGVQLGEFISHRNTEEKIYKITERDNLTGLLNRSSLEENLNNRIENNSSRNIAVFVFDIDKFKLINDVIGYKDTDLLLKSIANRLIQLGFTENNLLSRISGDKFVLIGDEIGDTNQAAEFALKLHSSFKDCFYINDEELLITPSIGIGFFPSDGATASDLLNNADLALAKAKSEGGNNFQFYSHELRVKMVDKLKFENELRHAISKNQFVLYYQPKINLKTGEIAGVESLVRWQHPERGLLQPDEFISLAEQNGYIVSISEWIVREVCSHIASGMLTIPVAINISAHHIQEEYNLSGYLQQMLKGFRISPALIELEITESVLMYEPNRVMSILVNLKNMGFILTLDDFGTKFSSLNYLKNIAVDKVKIDKSFVDDIPGNEDNTSIVKAIIALFHTLNKKIVAEGIENKAQLEFLAKENCDEGQGYFFSKPLPLDEINGLIKQAKRWTL